MNPDILIIREGDGYRLLHGHLRLASVLLQSGEVNVAVKGEGNVKIMKTCNGYAVGHGGRRLPLYRN